MVCGYPTTLRGLTVGVEGGPYPLTKPPEGLGSAAVTAPRVAIPGRHGAIVTGPDVYQSLYLTFEVRILADSEAELVVREGDLKRAWRVIDNGTDTLTLQMQIADETRFYRGRPGQVDIVSDFNRTDEASVSQSVARLTFEATAGYYTAAEDGSPLNSLVFDLSGPDPGSGDPEFPALFPFVFTGSSQTNTVSQTVTPVGGLPADWWATFVPTAPSGEIEDPEITVNDCRVTVLGVVSAGDVLTVDSRTGVATLGNGQLVPTSLDSVWCPLQPGEPNEIVVSAYQLVASSIVTIFWETSWP